MGCEITATVVVDEPHALEGGSTAKLIDSVKHALRSVVVKEFFPDKSSKFEVRSEPVCSHPVTVSVTASFDAARPGAGALARSRAFEAGFALAWERATAEHLEASAPIKIRELRFNGFDAPAVSPSMPQADWLLRFAAIGFFVFVMLLAFTLTYEHLAATAAEAANTRIEATNTKACEALLQGDHYSLDDVDQLFKRLADVIDPSRRRASTVDTGRVIPICECPTSAVELPARELQKASAPGEASRTSPQKPAVSATRTRTVAKSDADFQADP